MVRMGCVCVCVCVYREREMEMPASEGSIEGADNFVFIIGETSKSDMRPQIV